jgi:hypothetical protein
MRRNISERNGPDTRPLIVNQHTQTTYHGRIGEMETLTNGQLYGTDGARALGKDPALKTFELFPGYVAEQLPETPGKIGFAYKVTGPRGEWMLMRNQPNPTMLFVCPKDFGRRGAKIRGYEWFTDKGGTLRPCR